MNSGYFNLCELNFEQALVKCEHWLTAPWSAFPHGCCVLRVLHSRHQVTCCFFFGSHGCANDWTAVHMIPAPELFGLGFKFSTVFPVASLTNVACGGG